MRELLSAIGEDPDREGLTGTPDRVARWWTEFIDYNPGKMETVFENHGIGQMVAVTGIRVWSLCEHHLLPFWCDISIAYIPDGVVMGLSKLARIAQYRAHGLQLQERLTEQVMNDVVRIAGTQSVAVFGRGVHLCMNMRGVHAEGAITSTLMTAGVFADPKNDLRQTFVQLATQHKP